MFRDDVCTEKVIEGVRKRQRKTKNLVSESGIPWT